MENVKAIVKQVIKIWRLYKTQQLALTAAMRQEIPFQLRKLLSRDYMICSVLKKEMANFYDALKCCMRDACITRPETGDVMIAHVDGNATMALGNIVGLHRQIIAEYEILLTLVKDSNINTSILQQHRKQMDKMTDELSSQSDTLQSEEMDHKHFAM